MIESFNGFGNATIGTNDPEDQEKYIKFNTLVANLVILSTAVDMSGYSTDCALTAGRSARRTW